jgi:hypothetical protein
MPAKPLISYPENEAPPSGLTAAHMKHLAKYISPSYLNAETLERLAGQFTESSEVVMHNFLKPEIANAIKAETIKVDTEDYAPFAKDGFRLVPDHATGESDEWTLEGPSSKHRYLSLSHATPTSARTPTIKNVLTDLYPSEAFRAWLGVVSTLVSLAYRTEARRFRRGLDYTLANGEEQEGEPRLDGTLGLTWWAKDDTEDAEVGENEQDVGGWEVNFFRVIRVRLGGY